MIFCKCQEIEDMREGKLEKVFFFYADHSKGMEQLFSLTLNGIAVSVLHVPSTPTVQHTRLNDQLLRI